MSTKHTDSTQAASSHADPAVHPTHPAPAAPAAAPPAAAPVAPEPSVEAAPVDEIPAAEQPTAQAAFARFGAAALAVDAASIRRTRLDAPLAQHNVKIGVASVLAQVAVVRRELPAIPVEEIESLPELALAARYAVIQAARVEPAPPVVQAKVNLAHPLRRKLLAVAQGLAAMGLVPQAEVDAIRAGRGPQDSAQDLVDLADLFERHAAHIHGKHAVTAAMLDDARQIGAFLLSELRPEYGRAPATPQALHPAVEKRDRYVELLLQRHERLRKAGYYLYGDDFDRFVPALHSRRLGARPSATEPARPAEPPPAQGASPEEPKPPK